MGAPGSGNRWRLGAKRTTDEHHALDVRKLARAGALRPGYCVNWALSPGGKSSPRVQMLVAQSGLVLRYKHSTSVGEWKRAEYPVRITRTRCNFGGSRPWFLCPARGCGQRVAILYGDDDVFKCRSCHKLAYASSREDLGSRAERRAQRIQRRLGWEPGFLSGPGDKPKWMRWRTYARLSECYSELLLIYWYALEMGQL
jgi:hypothetical protein